MADLSTLLEEKPLNSIIVPGTHDSAAFALNAKPIGPAWLRALVRLSPSLIKRWTLTQTLGVYDQLCRGVRFLDLRVAQSADSSDGLFVCAHTFACVALKPVLYDVVAFLQSHGREVVVISVRPDWPHRQHFDAPAIDQLMDVLTSSLGPDLLVQADDLPTYGAMVRSGRRCLVFLQGFDAASRPRPGIWLNAGCSCLWANSSTAQGTVEGLLQLIAAGQQAGSLAQGYWWASAAVTPSAGSVVKAMAAHPFSSGLEQLAAEMEQLLPKLLQADLTGVAAVALDFVTEAAVRAIVALNAAPRSIRTACTGDARTHSTHSPILRTFSVTHRHEGPR